MTGRLEEVLGTDEKSAWNTKVVVRPSPEDKNATEVGIARKALEQAGINPVKVEPLTKPVTNLPLLE